MTMLEPRRPFEPIGEKSRRDMVIEGLADLAPLEAGSLISYTDIARWIGEPFPRRTGEYGERNYEPMLSVSDYLLSTRGILLLNVENVGYRVANDAEKVEHAERFGYLSALAKMKYGNQVLGSVDRSKVDRRQAELADFMQREMIEEQRVMRAKLRAEHKRASLWE